MKQIDETIKYFKEAPISTNENKDNAVFNKILDAANTNKPSANKLNMWRIIMHSKITKSAAAIIIIAVLTAIYQLTGSIDGASVAFGQIKQAVEKVPWIHSVNNTPNGIDEGWLSFKQKIEINKKSDGKVVYENYIENVKYIYSPVTDTITCTDISDKQFALGTTNFLAFIDAILNKEQLRGAKLTRTEGVYNQVAAEIWKVVRKEKNWSEEIRMYFNIENHLPLAVEVKSGTADEDPDYISHITFDYPANGPQDIYVLGAPQSAKIVDLLPASDVSNVLETYQEYRNEAPSKYSAVVIFDTEEAVRIENNVFGYATIVYKNGQRQYGEQYKIFASATDYTAQLGDTFDTAVNWCSQSDSTTLDVVDLFDGVYHYQSKYNEDDAKWERQPRRDYPEHLGNYLEVLKQKGWPRIGIQSDRRPDIQVRIIKNEYSQTYGLICIERLRQGMNYDGKHKAMPPTMQLYYLNPQKDYICERLEEYRRRNASWQKDKSWLDDIDPNNIRPDATSITQIEQYSQTDLGKWYPKEISNTIIGVHKDGTPGVFKTVETIYLEIDPEFPKDIFDSNKLP